MALSAYWMPALALAVPAVVGILDGCEAD